MARLLYRVGRFSARHRLLTFLTWTLTLVVLAVITLTGMKFSDGAFEIPGTESSTALNTVEREFPDTATQPGTGSLQVVVQTPDDENVTDPAAAARIIELRENLSGLPHVKTVSDPLDPANPYISPDLSTAVLSVDLSGITDANAETVYDEVLEAAENQRDQDWKTAEVGGSLGSGVPEILGPSEIVGVAIAFLVLVLTFGSLRAAGANMVGAIVGVGVGILGVLASSALYPIGSITPILAVMLGLAVSIDYGLFVLARFRAELRAGREIDDAIGISVGTAGSSVVFAGTTVIIALTGLAVVNIPFITEMGLAGAVAVLIAILMALTLLPALMMSMGHNVLPRKERSRYKRSVAPTRESGLVSHRGKEQNTRIGYLERWGASVVKHPLLTVIGAVTLLVIMAVPVLSLKTSLSMPGGEDPQSTQRAAYNLIAEKFGDGAQNPLIVLAEGQAISKAQPDIMSTLESIHDVQTVFPSGVSTTGDTAIFTVIPESGAVDEATKDLVRDIRKFSNTIPGVSLQVTGVTAVGIDVDQKLGDALVLYIVLIVGLSLILMMIMFRSILVPLIATAGFLLSLGAGLGVTVAVFQWGWLGSLFAAPLGNPLLSLLPILIVGILFGLAMDYQVFLVSRIHEAHSKGLPAREAILDGFGRTAFIVVAAATIMAAVFGGFALSPSSLVASIALALAVGVVADAFLVRMVIVPAILALTGEAAWWLPKWLGRVLPHIDAEGSALEAPTVSTVRDDFEATSRVQ